MIRWNQFGWWGTLAGVGLAAVGIILGTSRTQAIDPPQPAGDRDPGRLIVHEWGTFTSFSGSNGVQLDFRPLINEDLPSFVVDRQSQSGVSLLLKGRIRARIRMETPVTYFYTDEERTIRASVEFPQGLLTEFYPPVAEMAPALNVGLNAQGKEPFGNSRLDWGEIHLIPTAKLRPAVADDRIRNWMHGLIEQRLVPQDGNSANHYYHARETDSALVHVHRPAKGLAPGGDHLEKFLFYRGLGRFDQPLQATVLEDETIRVTNPGGQPIRSLFRVTVAGETIAISEIAELAPGATGQFPPVGTPVTLPELKDRVARALVRERLYPREAAAMVNTWADSWFAEQGTRVFYMVPREITDKVLPLTISPPPDESVRVLVGRLEVMSPSVERQLLDLVAVRAAARAELQAAGQNPNSLPIPAELLALGRLAEPALVRIRELARDDAVSNEAEILLVQCREELDKLAQK